MGARTEKEKMLAGEAYDASDPELAVARLRARELCRELNSLPAQAPDSRRKELTARLFGVESDVYVTPPFFCDYGTNIALGSNVFFNFNCVILDGLAVSIGSNVLVGPAVQIYTALHPFDAHERRSGIEFGKPVRIGNDVWLGGGAIVCPGVSVGDGAVIGAGSVVVKDIPAGAFAAGNPCRVIRSI